MKGIALSLIILLCVCENAISQENAPPSSSDTPRQTLVEPVYRVGGSVKAPHLIYSPNPDYPKQARKGHGAGPIDIVLTVGSDGQSRDVRAFRGISPEIDQAAVEAVERWKFKPATKDGSPVAVRINVHFDFQP
jgi:TonB family protein